MANASSAITPQMDRVRQLVEQAKSTSEGITITFRVEKYGSLTICRTNARSMQTSFCNLRVRSRRTAQRLRGETEGLLLSNVRGEFDDLACVVRPLPRDAGYTVSFIPAMCVDIDLEVTDRATGKPLESEDPVQNRFIFLMGKWFKEDAEARKQRRRMFNPFTAAELDFMWEHDAETCREMNIPTRELNAEQDAKDYASVDLADLGEDELEIVNPSESE